MGETESMPETAPAGGGRFSRILMGILGLLLGLLMIAAALYRILAELGGAGGDIPDEIAGLIQTLRTLYYLVAPISFAIIVSSIATFINVAWARKALLGSIGAMFVLLVVCGIYESRIIEAVFGVYVAESEEIHWRYKPMTTFSMLMAYTSLFFGGLIWLIDYIGRPRNP
ncbi:MAG: hypothetical protein MK219_04345 [Candidatus Poseidoniia archaeon]|nr:hypothetical protein [Candidatus Poseidoniia archaeon]